MPMLVRMPNVMWMLLLMLTNVNASAHADATAADANAHSLYVVMVMVMLMRMLMLMQMIFCFLCIMRGISATWCCMYLNSNWQAWLILPVVICCLSQRLSHACLSISFYLYGETVNGSLKQFSRHVPAGCFLRNQYISCFETCPCWLFLKESTHSVFRKNMSLLAVS